MGRMKRLTTQGALIGFGASMIFGATACNEHPVAMSAQRGHMEVLEVVGGTDSPMLDILWMIDNSGSMCRSQEILRDGIREFIEILGEVNLDFHIGVTTTHMKERHEYHLEPIALPGRLQSTPQPIPGFDPACHHPVDSAGEPIRTEFDPVLENIRVAVECTHDPEQFAHLLTPNMRALECALDDLYFECSAAEIESFAQAAGVEHFTLEIFFPRSEDYRPIPLVLRSEDYIDAQGALDLDRLEADFSCMSLVGTRGFGFEMGLASVVKALSPELTGGPGADPSEFPNAGFVREDSQLSVIFITDENDCSHDGRDVETPRGLVNIERTSCDVHQCTIQENLGADGALLPVESLRHQFLRNAAITKGRLTEEEADEATYEQLHALVAADILPASIHGPHRIDSTAAPDMCVQGYRITPSCRSRMGVAWSGHRYADFVRGFPRFFPDPRDTTDLVDASRDVDLDEIDGLVCDDFEPALRDIANMLRPPAGSCVTNVYRCADTNDQSCPANASTGEPGQCVRYPAFSAGAQEALYYCDTGLEVRLRLPQGEDDLDILRNTGFCIEDTYNQPGFEQTCVVHPENYQLVPCFEGAPANQMAIDFTPGHERWFQVLGDIEVLARYTRVPSTN